MFFSDNIKAVFEDTPEAIYFELHFYNLDRGRIPIYYNEDNTPTYIFENSKPYISGNVQIRDGALYLRFPTIIRFELWEFSDFRDFIEFVQDLRAKKIKGEPYEL